MGEIPDHPCAVFSRSRGEAGKVGDLGGAVVDEGSHDHRTVAKREVGVVEIAAHLASGLLRDALHDVTVGGELPGVDADEVSVRGEINRGSHQLVEVDARRVVDDHLSGAGSDDRGEFVPDLEWEVEPMLPRGDETLRPLSCHDLMDAVHGPPRGHAERVAVEVGEVGIVDHELVAPPGQRICCVEIHCLSPMVVEAAHRASSGTREESTPLASSRSISSVL